MNMEIVKRLAEENDSFYLYDEGEIMRRGETLRRDMDSVQLLYSIKANPNRQVVRCLAGLGFGADAASSGEVEIAMASGMDPEMIYYSAPGKTDRDLEAAMGRCTIIADSPGELGRISRMAVNRGIRVSVGMRIAPELSVTGAAAGASKFGIDEAEALKLSETWSFPNISLAGIHVHAGSQILDAEMIMKYHERVMELARKISLYRGCRLDFVNLGSGLGIPYADGDPEVDTGAVGANLKRIAGDGWTGTKLLLETGRYVAGPAGIYATVVVDKKESQGRKFVILASTLNGFIRPSLVQMVNTCAGCGEPKGCEPLFSGSRSFVPEAAVGSEKMEKVTLVGSLCTAADVVATEVELPVLVPGDVVWFRNAGAYGAVLSPMQFASQPMPKEFFVTAEGGLIG